MEGLAQLEHVPKVPVHTWAAVECGAVKVHGWTLPLPHVRIVLQLIDAYSQKLEHVDKNGGWPVAEEPVHTCPASHVEVGLGAVGRNAQILEQPHSRDQRVMLPAQQVERERHRSKRLVERVVVRDTHQVAPDHGVSSTRDYIRGARVAVVRARLIVRSLLRHNLGGQIVSRAVGALHAACVTPDEDVLQ